MGFESHRIQVVSALGSSIKTVQSRRQKRELASSFCPLAFAPVESFLVAKVSMAGERRCDGDIDRVVT